MKRRILMVTTSMASLGEGGAPSGAWLEELAAPWYEFLDRGCDIELASPAGGKVPIDPMSLDAPWLSPNGQRFLADPVAIDRSGNSSKLKDVAGRDFDAAYLVGGAASAWDFPGEPYLAALTSRLHDRGSVTAGVCHGVLGLTGSLDSEGNPLVRGRSVTGVSNAEEAMTGFDAIVPVLPESRLRELGARYSCAEPLQEHVIADGRLMTGQNPASAGPLARAVLQLLDSTGR